MCKKNYVPLHNHSHYSALDGYGTIDEYVEMAKELGFTGFGLADHGTASGIYSFIKKMQDAGLTPVPGVEFYVAPENELGAKAKHQIFYGENGTKSSKYDVSKGAYTHLTVFAYNNEGLSNLFKLTSMSYEKEHFYTSPRIDTNMLVEHSEGLIVTTGCPSSEISTRFLLGQDDKAYEYAMRMKSVFGDNYYVEIMDHKMENEELERILIPKQIKLARDLDIKIIATNDSHYARKEDAIGQEHFLAMSTKAKMTDVKKDEGGTRFAFSGDEYYIKDYDEMYKVYPQEVAEEALHNTLEIVEKCKGISLDYRDDLRPFIDIPEGYSEATYLQKLIYDGFVKKRGHLSKEIQEESVKRIQEEFKVIHSNDFLSYFLVVNDYIQYAHDNGIGVGAGRGSIGGSEIAYVLDISNTDPIRFDLLFERFLSPGRGSLYEITYESGEIEEIAVSQKKAKFLDKDTSKIVYVHELQAGDIVNFEDSKKKIKRIYVKVPGSAPDVDTDFHSKRREEVIDYCIKKYGRDKVALILTFGTFKAKKAFKAIASLHKIPFAASHKISSLLTSDDIMLKDVFDPSSKTYKETADFRNAVEADEKLMEIVKVATGLEGRISEVSAHPCGVIISSKTIADKAPTLVRQDDNRILTQWEYPELEDLGFIKMDLLGLELIDSIQATLANIENSNASSEEQYRREIPNMRELIEGEMDDVATYENLKQGNTVGIFQLGGDGVRELLRAAKPEAFMEIANITALYRPGPMKSGAHIQYSNRKNGIEEISYIHPDFEGTEVQEVLQETFGLMIFQEQIMLIAGRYAGFTPYETDKLRKAVGKKKMKIMMAMKPKFVEGCLARGASEEAIELLWETIRVFGEYGFNKSHSVSYAINIYQTVYLKTHYPADFMAAVIHQANKAPEKLKRLIQEATRMNLRIGAVEINSSQVETSSTGINPNREYDIVYGFSGVAQLNEVLSAEIVKERNENGPYTSVVNFIERILKRHDLGAAVLSNLALAGAFDSFGVSRKLVKEKAKALIDSCAKKEKKGTSLFDLMGTGESVAESIEIKGEDYTYNEMIKEEANVVGMFLSGHPVSNLGHISKSYKAVFVEDVIKSEGRGKTFNVFGTITAMKAKRNKTGKKTVAIQIDDSKTVVPTWLPKDIIDSLDKGEELIKISKGEPTTNKTDALQAIMDNEEIKPMEPISLYEPYVFQMKRKGYGDEASISVVGVKKLKPAKDGSLPYEIKITSKDKLKKMEELINAHENKNGFYVKATFPTGKTHVFEKKIKLSVDFIIQTEKIVGKDSIITKDV